MTRSSCLSLNIEHWLFIDVVMTRHQIACFEAAEVDDKANNRVDCNNKHDVCVEDSNRQTGANVRNVEDCNGVKESADA